MEERVSGFCITKAGNVRCGGGGGGGGGTGTKCGRWNPTTEQVKVLTDLFRSGLRTPSTDQIQKISTQLSFYGKIESKNVFYWFQNHKARERQKRRRVVTVSDDDRPSSAIRRDENISSARYFGEISAVNHESERVIETLQLFPLNSFQLQGVEEAHEKLRLQANECKEPILMSNFAYSFGTNMDHPPLDLRLSFCN